MTEQPAHLTPIQSDRGFFRLPTIKVKDSNQEINVLEASTADGPHLWLGISSGPTEATAHLSLEQAQQVRDQLNWMVENHYQVKGR